MRFASEILSLHRFIKGIDHVITNSRHSVSLFLLQSICPWGWGFGRAYYPLKYPPLQGKVTEWWDFWCLIIKVENSCSTPLPGQLKRVWIRQIPEQDNQKSFQCQQQAIFVAANIFRWFDEDLLIQYNQTSSHLRPWKSCFVVSNKFHLC